MRPPSLFYLGTPDFISGRSPKLSTQSHLNQPGPDCVPLRFRYWGGGNDPPQPNWVHPEVCLGGQCVVADPYKLGPPQPVSPHNQGLASTSRPARKYRARKSCNSR